ncbi:MAG: lipopolysaccharide kinase InaA family protein [Candidatus Aminicenantales bacterium]
MNTHGKNTVEYRIEINPRFASQALLQRLERGDGIFQDPSCRVLHAGRNRLAVVRLPVGEGKHQEVAIKEFLTRGVDSVKTLFLPSKAEKAWRGALALQERGIPTPEPVACVVRRGFLGKRESLYLALYDEKAEEVRTLFRRLPAAELRLLVESLARHLALCHKKGILHRDLSDGNVLVRKKGQGQFTFSLIDTNRIRVRKRWGVCARVKSLVRLGIPAAHQKLFLEAYFGDAGLSAAIWMWYRVCKQAFEQMIAIKKALRLREAARKLGLQ